MRFDTATAFIQALRKNAEVLRVSGGRIFYVARDKASEEKDKVPYIIVQDGDIATDATKDEYVDGATATIPVLVVAKEGEDLAGLCTAVEAAVEKSSIRDWSVSADAVQYDADKPCYFRTLTYRVGINQEQ